MSSNLGTIMYGDLLLLPGYDTASSGFGNMTVSGTTLLAGASTTVSGTFQSTGGATFDSTLLVQGIATFSNTVNFTQPTTQTGILTVTNTTDSTNINTGALQVKGGMSVIKSTWLGSTLNAAGGVTFQDTLDVSGTSTLEGIVTVSNTSDSTLFGNGALVVAGGLGLKKDLRIGNGNIFLAGDLVLNTSTIDAQTYLSSPSNKLNINETGIYDCILNGASTANFNVAGATNTSIVTGLNVFVTTDASSITTGAVKIAGGASVVKNLYVGGNVNVVGTIAAAALSMTSTTQSTSTISGALVVPGGVGIGKNVYMGGVLDVKSTAGAESFIGSVGFQTDSVSANWIRSGDLTRTASSWVSLKFAPLATNTAIMTVNATDVTINATTASSSTSTGSLIVTGGAGVAGDVFLGAALNVAGATKLSGDAWLSGNNLFLNAFNSSTDGLRYSGTESDGGPLLFGENGGALATTTGSLKVALEWNALQSVLVLGTTDTTSSTTGALTVGGGVGVAKSLSVGTSVFVQGASLTSTGNDLFINAATASLYLRNTSGSISGELESTVDFFNFRTKNITSPSPISPFITFQIDKTTGYTLVLHTDNATSISTGAFQVAGGGSVTKDLYVGGLVDIVGDLTVGGTITASGGGPVAFSSTVDSTSPTTGAVTISGGLGVAKSIYVGGMNVTVNTTESTSITTGALQVAGGVGIVKDVFIGGSLNIATDLIVAGNITSTAGTVNFTNTTVSSSTSTGALVIAGGVGIGGAFYVGGVTKFVNATASISPITGAIVLTGGLGISGDTYTSGLVRVTNTIESSSSTTGSLRTAGGVGISKNLFVGGNTNVTGTLTVGGTISSSGPVTFTNTLDSTSPTSGSVVVSGGLGVMKALYVGSTIESTSSTTGGVVLSGGLGVVKNVSLGGNLLFDGTNPLQRFTNSGLAIPSFTTRSVGTKILLYSALSPTASDFALGMNSNEFWSSVPTNTGTHSFSWYGGTVKTLSLDGLGNMVANGTGDSTSTITGALQLLGGAGIGKNLYVGGALNVNTTSFFNGSITANSGYTGSGLMSLTNVTNSTTTANGALVVSGGVGIGLDVKIGGSVSVTGTSNLIGAVDTDGIMNVNNTTESLDVNTGALIVDGGLAIKKSVNIGGSLNVASNATINGNLYVEGSQFISNTEVLTTEDNIILVNSGPAGTAHTGISQKRYQLANDSSLGDLVANSVPEHSGMCQSPGTVTTIVLDVTASAVDDTYNEWWVYIYAGTGLGQVRKIKDYVGTTKTATIYDTADETASPSTPVEGLDFSNSPDGTSEYHLYSCQYLLQIWNESAGLNGEYIIGATPQNPTSNPTVPIHCEIVVHTGSLILDVDLSVDTIIEKTASAGVTIESILLKDGNLSGVGTINGSLLDVTGSVALLDNNLAGTVTIPGTDTFGAYSVLVMDTVNSGAAATFFVSGSTARSGSVTRVTSTKGSFDEHLTISWAQGDYPKLKFMAIPTNASGANVNYTVRVTRVV
jgi:hypothetical protein